MAVAGLNIIDIGNRHREQGITSCSIRALLLPIVNHAKEKWRKRERETLTNTIFHLKFKPAQNVKTN